MIQVEEAITKAALQGLEVKALTLKMINPLPDEEIRKPQRVENLVQIGAHVVEVAAVLVVGFVDGAAGRDGNGQLGGTRWQQPPDRQ